MKFNTPDILHKWIVHNQETNPNISHYIQKGYRSGVGLLLYLMKNS